MISLAILLPSLAIIAYLAIREKTTSTPIYFSTTSSIQKIQLPDHTVVTLSKNSQIAYPKGFDGRLREVTLKGEGFFDVARQPERPFIINTESGNIKVVGTSFNVNAKDSQLQVDVVEGKVLVYTQQDSAYLDPGFSATTASNSKVDVAASIDVNDWSYATRKLVFKNTSLKKVFKHIEKTYPYSIEVQNRAIENCELTATFDNIPIAEIMSMIGESLNLNVVLQENNYIVDGEGCR